MKKGQIAEGLVKLVKFPNKGIVEIPGETKYVIVKNVIPGQKVCVFIHKIRNEYAEGRLLKILEKAPDELESICPHFGKCGGCTYQNLPYRAQLEMKAQQVKQMLDHAVDEAYIWEGISPSPAINEYRNKMEFTFGDEYKDGPMVLGMHRRGSFYDIVNTQNCKIVDADCRKILETTLKVAEESGLPYYHRMRHVGFFRHLLVRKAAVTGEILISLITASGKEQSNLVCNTVINKMLKKWMDALLVLSLNGKISGILHTVNDSIADTVKDEGTRILHGKDYFYEKLLGMKFKITPFSFFQTNSLGAEILYKKVRDYVGEAENKVIFDLYSGTGTIAQILAPIAKRVLGVEIVTEAVDAARQNAKLNNLENCTFKAGDVLRIINEVKEVPDVIILDPPRDGVNPKALEKIIDFGVQKLVYIACKPTSLLRDIKVFQQKGYVLKRCACIDLFPHTYHVETVALLQKKFCRNT